ncbi:MAG: aldo/keto reductase [Clostridiales bacterium]|nr:aldo/keto reductase [Clostridiales bacterium]
MTQKLNYALSNNVSIPVIALGTWQAENGPVATDAVTQALNADYRHIDTAIMYGNEESVGKAVKLSQIPRNEIFITTKLNNNVRGYNETIEAIKESLNVMQTDYIDLFLIHWPNPIKFRDSWKESNAESWRAFEDMYKQGKIKAIGVSNFEAHHMDALLETATIMPMVNQIRISPGDEPKEIIEYCRQRNILLEAYCPLARGNLFKNKVLLELANKYEKSVAQLIIRWHLQKGSLPLPKSVSPSRIKENINVFDFEISEDDMNLISNVDSPFDEPIMPDKIDF